MYRGLAEIHTVKHYQNLKDLSQITLASQITLSLYMCHVTAFNQVNFRTSLLLDTHIFEANEVTDLE